MPASPVLAAILACLALASCQGAKPIESPPVVTVGDATVTLADVQAQQPGATAETADPIVISGIVDRLLLVQAADEAKLPTNALAEAQAARAAQVVRANAMAQRLAANVRPATAQEIDAYVAEHPEIFAERKFLVVDQIELQRPSDPNILARGGAIQSVDDMKAVLDAAGIASQRTVRVLDTAQISKAMIDRLLAVPPNAVFELGNGSLVTAGQIIQVRAAPLAGQAARDAAAAALKSRAADAAVEAGLVRMRKAAADKIKYAKGYSAPS